MKHRPTLRRGRVTAKSILRLLDHEHAKTPVLNSLTSPDAQQGCRHAIDEFVAWYCSEPRMVFNRIVVLRYRFHLESRRLAYSLPNAAAFTDHNVTIRQQPPTNTNPGNLFDTFGYGLVANPPNTGASPTFTTFSSAGPLPPASPSGNNRHFASRREGTRSYIPIG
jgi:hypothetical protein